MRRKAAPEACADGAFSVVLESTHAADAEERLRRAYQLVLEAAARDKGRSEEGEQERGRPDG
ncbi:MAG: hypothetical protein ABID84_05310 [Chloroflexota bacterium]